MTNTFAWYLLIGAVVATFWLWMEVWRVSAKRRAGIYPQVHIILRILAYPAIMLIWPVFVAMCAQAAIRALPSDQENRDG